MHRIAPIRFFTARRVWAVPVLHYSAAQTHGARQARPASAGDYEGAPRHIMAYPIIFSTPNPMLHRAQRYGVGATQLYVAGYYEIWSISVSPQHCLAWEDPIQ